MKTFAFFSILFFLFSANSLESKSVEDTTGRQGKTVKTYRKKAKGIQRPHSTSNGRRGPTRLPPSTAPMGGNKKNTEASSVVFTTENTASPQESDTQVETTSDKNEKQTPLVPDL